MLSPWLVDLLTQTLLFVVSCSCCGGSRKSSEPILQKIAMEPPQAEEQITIPLANIAEEDTEWDLVEAEEPETFGLQVCANRMHY